MDLKNFQKFNENRILMEAYFEILILNKPSLGSREVPHKIWARSQNSLNDQKIFQSMDIKIVQMTKKKWSKLNSSNEAFNSLNEKNKYIQHEPNSSNEHKK